LASLLLLFPSFGLTSLIALAALIISMVGMFQVQHHPAQSGRNFALIGMLLSILALIITVVVAIVAVPLIMKGHGQITATEQSTTDSE
jgi:Co/Zn/Cd efflux system component